MTSYSFFLWGIMESMLKTWIVTWITRGLNSREKKKISLIFYYLKAEVQESKKIALDILYEALGHNIAIYATYMLNYFLQVFIYI